MLGLVALAILFVLVIIFGGGPEHHMDGRGPLGSLNDPQSSITEGFDPWVGGPWTVGIALCLAQGNQPATLDGSVTPTATVGNDFRYLGAVVREFTPDGSHTPIGSMIGFPPNLPDTLRPLKGFAVRYPCQQGAQGRPAHYTELLIGFGRGAGTSGGGWLGVGVGYTVGSHHHVVSLGYELLVCGPAAPSRYCGRPWPSPTSGTP